MSPGEIISDSWSLYRTHWRHLVPVALAFYLILSLVTLVLGLVLGIFGVLVGALISLVGFFWLQGALVEAVADVRDGRADLSIAETFSRAQARIPALIVAGILAGIGIALGLVFLLVPGLVLLTWWCLISPVIVLEGKRAGESFGRSRELVRGHGWACFGVVLLTLILVVVAAAVLGALLGAVLPDWLASYASNVVVNSLTAPFVAVAFTLMYFRLRGPESVPAGASAVAA